MEITLVNAWNAIVTGWVERLITEEFNGLKSGNSVIVSMLSPIGIGDT